MKALFGKIIAAVDRLIHPDGTPSVIGVFDDLDKCVEAVGRLKYAYPRLVVHSPMPSHALENAIGNRPGPVRYFTFVGALLGGIGGFVLSAWASLEWNMVTGGKPIVSVPPFLIITFECTILFGAIATLIGFFHASRIPQPGLSKSYMADFGIDKFGIGIVCDDKQIDEAKAALIDAGASEAHRV